MQVSFPYRCLQCHLREFLPLWMLFQGHSALQTDRGLMTFLPKRSYSLKTLAVSAWAGIWKENHSIPLSIYLVHTSLICLCYGTQCWKPCYKLKTSNTNYYSSPSHSITEGFQIGQALLSLHKSMLTTSSHLLVPYILQNGFQYYLLHDLPSNQSEAHQSVVPQILLLSLLEDESNIYFLPDIEYEYSNEEIWAISSPSAYLWNNSKQGSAD